MDFVVDQIGLFVFDNNIDYHPPLIAFGPSIEEEYLKKFDDPKNSINPSKPIQMCNKIK